MYSTAMFTNSWIAVFGQNIYFEEFHVIFCFNARNLCTSSTTKDRQNNSEALEKHTEKMKNVFQYFMCYFSNKPNIYIRQRSQVGTLWEPTPKKKKLSYHCPNVVLSGRMWDSCQPHLGITKTNRHTLRANEGMILGNWWAFTNEFGA